VAGTSFHFGVCPETSLPVTATAEGNASRNIGLDCSVLFCPAYGIMEKRKINGICLSFAFPWVWIFPNK